MIGTLVYLIRHRERPAAPARWAVVWLKRLLQFLPLLRLLLRPAVLRRRGASVGRMSILGAAAFEGPAANLAVGDECSLGRCRVMLHDRVTIGRRAVVNDGAVILTATHRVSDPRWGLKTMPVHIGDYAWIATNAVVLPGVRIGVGAVVGAGAVVRDHVPDYAVVEGNPARPTGAERARELDYSPVLLTAPFEAWVGSPKRRS